MSEAVCEMSKQAFLWSRANVIQAQVRICNRASGKVLEKCGFISKGTQFSDTLVHGRLEKERFERARNSALLLDVA